MLVHRWPGDSLGSKWAVGWFQHDHNPPYCKVVLLELGMDGNGRVTIQALGARYSGEPAVACETADDLKTVYESGNNMAVVASSTGKGYGVQNLQLQCPCGVL